MKVAIIGQGYVGLTISVFAGGHYEVVGFDTNSKIIENLNPVECILNDYDAIESVRFVDSTRSDKEIILPAKTVFVAAGTSPNITYEKEYPKTFRMQDSTGYYQPYKAAHTA